MSKSIKVLVKDHIMTKIHSSTLAIDNFDNWADNKLLVAGASKLLLAPLQSKACNSVKSFACTDQLIAMMTI